MNLQNTDINQLKTAVKMIEANLGWLKEAIYVIEEKIMDEEDDQLRKFLEG